MDDEGLSVKDVLIGNKIRALQDKLIDVIEKEYPSLYKAENSNNAVITMCVSAAFNTFTTVVSTYIYEGYFDKKGLVDSLLQDFKLEIDRKLEGYKKEDLENS